MAQLTYRNQQLHLENIALAQIAEEVGTPTYVYSKAAIEDAYQQYRNAFDKAENGQRHKICYAVKANSNLAVLNVLAKLGSGFDIVSVGELERVLLAGGNAADVVFSGVAKQQHEIERALEVGIHCFNIESESELQRINRIAQANGVTARISLRVNPDVDAQTHPYISTGLKDNKFGIDIGLARDIYRQAADNSTLEIVGVDCHIGSQLTSLSPFAAALERVLKLVDALAEDGIQLQHIDVGGGLGVSYQDEQPPAHADYITQITEQMAGRPEAIIIEPGRSIVANAGVLLCRVDTIKQNGEKNFAIVDAAMNDMLRPALYNAWLGVQSLAADSNAASKLYDIVGPVCETGDFIAKEREIALREGDYLCINSAGAYGFVMASNYNSRGRPAEVMVANSEYRVVRARETLDDLVRGETVF